MSVWVTGRNVEVVQHAPFLDESGRNVQRQIGEQTSHDVPPGFLLVGEMQRLDRFFRCLMRSKACSFVTSGAL